MRDSAAATLEEQLRIVAIPAPSLREGRRAEYLAERFRGIGLADVSVDRVGNLHARVPHPGPTSGILIVSAHLDTVFPEELDLTPRQEGGRIYAPGIADNARGLAALVTLGAELLRAEPRTDLEIRLVATVGEEGNGDLRGVKHLFASTREHEEVAGFISIDGAGVRRIVHRAVGARRLRATFQGPGGHSWSDGDAPNMVNLAAAAVEALRRVPLPREPRAVLSVNRIGGGTSVNAVPEEAWMEIDLRSEDSETLAALESAARRKLEKVARARRGGAGPRITLHVESIGDRPCGGIPPDAPLVRAAVEATRTVGEEPELAASSTDANVPLALGIPGIAIGAGGEAGGIHTAQEWYADADGGRGLERLGLTVLAAAGG